MVKIHYILVMFLLLAHHTLSYRILNGIKNHDDRYKDYVSKLKMLRLLKYVNRLNHEDTLDQYEDEGFNYQEHITKKPRKFKYRFNRKNMQIPLNLNYEIIISEPIKRNGILFDDNNKMKTLNYYDIDEYNENNNLGYDEFNYQKMFKNYIQRNSDQNQRNTLSKISRSKEPCQHRQHLPEKKLETLKHIPKLNLKPPGLKSSVLYEYSDDNDLPKIDSHNKRKQKGFQLFMLNDDDDLASSRNQDELKTTRHTKHTDFDQYDTDSDIKEDSFLTKNHKYRRYQEGNKQRRHEPEVKSIYIKISDIEQIHPDTISPKQVKEADYDLDSTESERVVYIPPLKHTTIRKDQDFEKLTTKRHRFPEIPHKTEFSDTEFENGETTAAAGDDYDEMKTSKNYVTTSSTPTSLSSNNPEYDDYRLAAGGNDDDNKLNNNNNGISSYEDENIDFMKKSKKLKDNGCKGPCQQPSNDYEFEMPPPSPCTGSSSTCGGMEKSLCNMDKGPCGTEKNPCPVGKRPCGTEKNPCPTQNNQCTEKVLTVFSSNDDSLNQNFQGNFQQNKFRPFTGIHQNLNTYSNKPPPSNELTIDPYKFDYDEARQAHKFYSTNNYKSKDKTIAKGDWSSTRRPDGMVDDENSYSENEKLLNSSLEGGEDSLLGRLKQHKTNDQTSKSTMSSKFKDYGFLDLSTRPDKRNNKKQRSSIKIEDDEDYNNDNMFISTDILSDYTKSNGKSPNRRDNNENKEKNSKCRFVKAVTKKQQRRQATTSMIHSKSKRKNKIKT